MASEVYVKGLRELQKLLDELPVKLETNVMRGGLRAGAKLILQQAKANAPKGQTASENERFYGGYAGALRDSIRLGTRLRGAWIMARVIVGGKSAAGHKADVWYAHLIEFTGAKPHTITAKHKKGLTFGGLFFQSVHHPGMKAHPFLRPALDGMASAAVVASGEYIKKRLTTKEGLDASYIKVEGDE
jgi:HK97 gp10 family phage protein